MHRIVTLAVGSDSHLLETRNQVLRSARHTLVSGLSIDAALKEFAARDFDLVSLCHLIPELERARPAEAIYCKSPLVSQRVAERDRLPMRQSKMILPDCSSKVRSYCATESKTIPSNAEEPDHDTACA